MKTKHETVLVSAMDVASRAAEVLRGPLPSTEPELSREVERRSERIASFFKEYRGRRSGYGEEP